VSSPTQAFSKCRRLVSQNIDWCVVKNPASRCRRLLRTRCNRPCRGCSPNKPEKFPPLHAQPLAHVRQWYRAAENPDRDLCPLGVKMRRTQREQIESVIPLFPDLDGASRYFADGPKADIL